MLATCSVDKTVAVWDTKQHEDSALATPVMCASKDMQVGKLFTLSFYESSSSLLVCGGSGNEPALWDFKHEEMFQKRFAGRISSATQTLTDRIDNEEKNGDFSMIMTTKEDAATTENGNNDEAKEIDRVVDAATVKKRLSSMLKKVKRKEDNFI